MVFVYLYLIIAGAWIAINPVLISQSRMSEADAKRADLDLRINRLAAHEITRLASLQEAVARQAGVPVDADRAFQDVKQDVAQGAAAGPDRSGESRCRLTAWQAGCGAR